VDSTIHAQRMWALCNLPQKPKLHNWQHLAVGIVGGLEIRQHISHAIARDFMAYVQTDNRIHFFGAPALTGTWHEEGLNRWLKAIAQCASSQVFHRRVLTEFNKAYGPGAKRRRM
jgi:hypothetical protein